MKCIGSSQNIGKKQLELNRKFSVISSPVCLYEGKYYIYLARRRGVSQLICLCKIKELLNDYPTIFNGYKLMNTLKCNFINAEMSIKMSIKLLRYHFVQFCKSNNHLFMTESIKLSLSFLRKSLSRLCTCEHIHTFFLHKKSI